jgi:hypothetical protein
MDDLGIFIAGTFVTVLVVAALSLLFWAAIEDGRTQRAAELGLPHDLDETAGGRLPEAVGGSAPILAPGTLDRPAA